MTRTATSIARRKMRKLERYVGRIVRLQQQAYLQIISRGQAIAERQENRFLVAAVDRRMRQLICYGGNFRINVSPSDIILV